MPTGFSIIPGARLCITTYLPLALTCILTVQPLVQNHREYPARVE